MLFILNVSMGNVTVHVGQHELRAPAYAVHFY